MKKILTILLLLLSSLAFGQTPSVDTEKYKNYKACADCFEDWKTSNGNEVGSPARTTMADGSSRNNIVTPVKQEGKRVLGQTIAILTGAIATGILVAISSK